MQGHKVYLDANIFIYAIEAIQPWAKELTNVFVGLKSSEFSAVTSGLSLAECLVMPIKNNRHDLVQIYRQALLPRPYLEISPIDIDVLIFAANVRAQLSLKLPDAIHAATALTSKCTALLTNDAGFSQVSGSGIEFFLLSEWIN